MSKGTSGVRFAEIDRETNETSVSITLDLDGGDKQDIATGLGFFDHMLHQLAFHGRLAIGLKASGDLEIDDHHTVEDVGISLGMALREALASSDNIVRFADNVTPMDEALVQVAIDLSGRSACVCQLDFRREKIGDVATECLVEFFQALSRNGNFALHIRKIHGENDHHVAEAAFKGLGRAIHAATRMVDRRGATSTKGHL